jgi:ferrous iron transport protein B
VLELPAYQVPDFNTMLKYSWRQSAEFMHKAGTFILGFSMVLWLLLNLPWGVTNPQESYYGKVSSLIAPTLSPAGFGNWESSGALVTGLVAKELVVSSLSQIYEIAEDPSAGKTVSTFIQDLDSLGTGLGVATLDAGKAFLEAFTPGISLFPHKPDPENTALSRALQQAFTPLSAAAFLVFVLLYIPCVATISAQKQEFGLKWAGLSVAITMVVPWVLAVIVYQGGLLFGWGR